MRVVQRDEGQRRISVPLDREATRMQGCIVREIKKLDHVDRVVINHTSGVMYIYVDSTGADINACYRYLISKIYDIFEKEAPLSRNSQRPTIDPTRLKLMFDEPEHYISVCAGGLVVNLDQLKLAEAITPQLVGKLCASIRAMSGSVQGCTSSKNTIMVKLKHRPRASQSEIIGSINSMVKNKIRSTAAIPFETRVALRT